MFIRALYLATVMSASATDASLKLNHHLLSFESRAGSLAVPLPSSYLTPRTDRPIGTFSSKIRLRALLIPNMSPQRRFGTPSRAVNSGPYQKPESTGNTPGKVAKGAVDFILNQEPATPSSTEHATRYDNAASSSALQLPFVKEESFDTLPTPFHYGGSPLESQAKLETFHQELQESFADTPGMPSQVQWHAIVESYLSNLHDRKRDKALINRTTHGMIFETLSCPESTHVGTPQFRFWARKMFQLVETSGVTVITHGGRPVAVKEHMYEILCMCHAESDHAGRDKTCKVLRSYYTWIPKELVANFVKACPTCAKKRAFNVLFFDTSRFGEDIMPRRDSVYMTTPSPLTESPVTTSYTPSLTGPLLSAGPNDSGAYIVNGNIVHCVDGLQQKFRSDPIAYAQHPRHTGYPSEFNALGLQTTRQQADSGNEELTLPPFNGPTEGGLGTENGARDIAGVEEASNTALPPLMPYLTRDGGITHNNTSSRFSGAGYPPIDPSLLGELHRSHSGTSIGSFPPTPLLTVGILGEPTSSEEAAFRWHRANADVPSSVSPNSQMSLSPYSPSPAFFSPTPMKIEERSPILEFPPETKEEPN